MTQRNTSKKVISSSINTSYFLGMLFFSKGFQHIYICIDWCVKSVISITIPGNSCFDQHQRTFLSFENHTISNPNLWWQTNFQRNNSMINQVGLDFVYEILRNVSTEDVSGPIAGPSWDWLRQVCKYCYEALERKNCDRKYCAESWDESSLTAAERPFFILPVWPEVGNFPIVG